MTPASNASASSVTNNAVVTAVAVDLQIAFRAFEQRLRRLAISAIAVVVRNHLGAEDRPDPSSCALSRCLHALTSFVGMQVPTALRSLDQFVVDDGQQLGTTVK